MLVKGNLWGAFCGSIIFLVTILFFPVAVVADLVKIDVHAESGSMSVDMEVETDFTWEYLYGTPGATGTWEMPVGTTRPMEYDPTPGSPDSGDETLVATIRRMSISITSAALISPHPIISLSFEVQAGNYDGLTTPPNITYNRIGGTQLW